MRERAARGNQEKRNETWMRDAALAWLTVVLLLTCGPTRASDAGDTRVTGLDGHVAIGTESRHLVLGAEYNIAEVELRIFLASLRGSGCQASVVLFSGRVQAHTHQLAERFGATLVPYDFEALNRTYGPVGVHRFHLYRRFLAERRGQYDFVLHTDVRDVLFQDNPFERIEAHGGGVFFLESNHLLIGTSPTNRGWMTENCTVYGREKMLERTGHRLRCCSGNMFGTADAVYWYARLMEEEQQRTSDAERDAHGQILGRGWCADQAVHQALLWTGQFSAKMQNVTTYHNEDGPLCTMGDMLSINVDEFGDVRNSKGDLYAVVHQYDRHKRVRDTITHEEDAAENLHPSFIPSYQDRVLYGDPSKITLHYNVDTSLPPPPSSKHALPAEKEQEACHLEAASTRAGTDKASVLSPSPLTPAPASTPAPEVAQDQQQAASAQAWEQAARWQHLISSAPEAELPHVRALADLVLQRPPAFQQYDAARFAGRGVVMAAGGRLQIVNAYCVVRALRAAGCELPIALFYAGASEMSAHVVQVLEGLDVQVLDIYHSVDASDGELPLRGFQMKAFAVLHSSFEQVLWLDSDAVPARNLTTLFDNSLYQRHGSLFWQDWSLDPHWLTAEWMAVYGMQMRAGEREVEAGQFVLCKRRAWLPLQLAVYMNRHFEHFYRRLYGDKDTWRLAFKMAGVDMGLVPLAADVLGADDPSGRRCGNTMLHKDELGRPITMHRTLQTLPGVPTPMPDALGELSDETLRQAAAAGGVRLWQWRSRGGRQALVPRLNDAAEGWRVEKLDVDHSQHLHWCLYFDDDSSVHLEAVDEGTRQLEDALKGYMLDLAATGVLETLGSSIVT